MYKKNCMQFAEYLKLIGNLLEELKISELKMHPATRELLKKLEDALRRSYILVNRFQNRSYPYLLPTGWYIVRQFREAQNEIYGYLKLIPLITPVDYTRLRAQCITLEEMEKEMEKNCESSTGVGVGVASNGCGKVMKEVACPTCTVHLQVEVPGTGSGTIEWRCSVCEHPFTVCP